MKKTAEYLQAEFFQSTGINWKNSQGEPDIDYVAWLEKQIISQPSQVDGLPKTEEDFEKLSQGYSLEVYANNHYENGIRLGVQLASAIIAKERAEKEELAIKLNLSGIDNENLRIEVQFLKKENEQLKQSKQ